MKVLLIVWCSKHRCESPLLIFSYTTCLLGSVYCLRVVEGWNLYTKNIALLPRGVHTWRIEYQEWGWGRWGCTLRIWDKGRRQTSHWYLADEHTNTAPRRVAKQLHYSLWLLILALTRHDKDQQFVLFLLESVIWYTTDNICSASYLDDPLTVC